MQECLSGMLIKKWGLDIEAGNFKYDTSVHHTHEGSIGNLCTEEIKKQMQKIVEILFLCSYSIKNLLE